MRRAGRAATARPAAIGLGRRVVARAARCGRRATRAARRARSSSPSWTRERAARQVAAAAELGEERALGARPRGARRRRRSRRASASVASSSARHSTASAPWPTCGSITDGSSSSSARSREPEPSSAAAATTIASKLGGLARAGSRCCRAARRTSRSGRSAASCARRRTEPVPTVAPVGSAGERAADERVARVGALGNGGEHEPVGRWCDGRSLAECTARSARPSSTACCTSFTNTPVPPIAWIGTSVRRVAGGRDDHVARRRAPSSAATRSACQRASALPRRGHAQRPRHQSSVVGVVGLRQAEQLDERVGVELAARACRRRPSPARSARAAAC